MKRDKKKALQPVAEGLRPIDAWRNRAWQPWPGYRLRGEVIDNVLWWELRTDMESHDAGAGVVVSRWRDVDAPGLADWMFDALPAFHGAWHLAREQQEIHEGRTKGARNAAEAAKAVTKKADNPLITVGLALLRADPSLTAAGVAKQFAADGKIHGNEEWFAKKLRKALREEATEER